MHIVITENRDKAGRIVNGQDAVVLSGRGNTIVVQFPDNQRAFVYPVTHHLEGQGNVTRYPFTPAYARTICKSQGQNLKHLLLWLDCPTVPPAWRTWLFLVYAKRRTYLYFNAWLLSRCCL